LGKNTVTTNEHLVAVSNAFHNIGANDNDTCMHLFVNYLEGKATTNIFYLPPKILSTWEELVYWFKSSYGQPKSPAEKLRECNNISYKDGETIKYFNLHFTKLYNQILELISPQNEATFMHYYNALPSSYRHRIEEKAIENLGSTLQDFLGYEEQLERTGLPKGDLVKKTNMSSILQLMQDMNNRMISYKRKGTSSSSPLWDSSSSITPFINTNENNFQLKAIVTRCWCNLCEENHDENACEVKKNSRDKIFGKRPDTAIDVLDWAESEDVMVINARNKSYTAKGKFDIPCTSSAPSSSSQSTNTQAVRTSDFKRSRSVFSPSLF
jgi:hypothetical protein